MKRSLTSLTKKIEKIKKSDTVVMVTVFVEEGICA